MPTYRLDLEYDGTDFHGWQRQADRITVQQALEEALAVALHTPCTVVGSGRTDAGVHARGQVAHIHLSEPTDGYRLRRALNGLLPRSVAVLALQAVEDGFHARYDARQRHYRYYISTLPRPLDRHRRYLLRPVPDFDAMNTAARLLLGCHDFSAFCRTRSETRNRTCTLSQAHWTPEAYDGNWHFAISGDRFLHGMVRAIVGTLLQIGRGKRALDDLPGILASRDRREAGPAAPAHGLVLEQVDYA